MYFSIEMFHVMCNYVMPLFMQIYFKKFKAAPGVVLLDTLRRKIGNHLPGAFLVFTRQNENENTGN